MPAKEIKALRLAGKLDEAYAMAKAELEAEPDNIWPKRPMSWVLYSQLDKASDNLDQFIAKLDELKALELPASEDMLFDNLSLVIAKAARHITSQPTISLEALNTLLEQVKEFPLKKPSKWYSALFNAFHKGFKESDRYHEFADWWNFENFREEDYQKEKMPSGKEVMAIAEQGYIAYAKHLLPKQTPFGDVLFDEEKVQAFMPKLEHVVESYPQFQYPAYFQAKLLLALGDQDNMLSVLLPFAKKKRNDFWVWEVLSEAFKSDPDKVLACYCRALSCNSPEEMLVNLRQKMAAIFIQRGLYNEAKTEIEKSVAARLAKGWPVPNIMKGWQSTGWYKGASTKKSNYDFYKQHLDVADDLLYSDVAEESIIVSFVNSDKKMLNFIASEEKQGFFKYERYIDKVNIGDILKVRFKHGSNDGIHQVYTVVETNDAQLRQKFFREFEGEVKIPEGKGFGFVNDVFLPPALVSNRKLATGMAIKGQAIKTFNPDKKQWGWKVISIE